MEEVNVLELELNFCSLLTDSVLFNSFEILDNLILFEPFLVSSFLKGF